MRNLFGWSSPPKRKDRKYSRLRAKALQDLIEAKEAHQLFVDIEEHGDGYVVPLSLLRFLNPGDGTIKKGPMLYATKSATGAGGATLTIGTDTEGTHVLIHVIQSTFLVDATVADRTARTYFPTLGLGGVAGTTPSTLLLYSSMTLSASQYGYMLYNQHRYYQTVDNGSHGTSDLQWPMPLYMRSGGQIKAIYTANGQTADASGIDILYEVVG